MMQIKVRKPCTCTDGVVYLEKGVSTYCPKCRSTKGWQEEWIDTEEFIKRTEDHEQQKDSTQVGYTE